MFVNVTNWLDNYKDFLKTKIKVRLESVQPTLGKGKEALKQEKMKYTHYFLSYNIKIFALISEWSSLILKKGLDNRYFCLSCCPPPLLYTIE